MRTATRAMLIFTLFLVAGWGTTANSYAEKGHHSKPLGISLNLAALQGNIEAIRQHIKAGSDLNEKDAYGSTPLIIATTFGKTEAAKALIEAGADLNARNNEGSTALHVAAFLCRTEIFKALLDKGANKYLRNNAGDTVWESVAAPFDDVKGIYDSLGKALGPLGLKLDYEQIRTTRPKIAQMLRPRTEELETVVYKPLSRDDWKISTPAEQGLDPMLVTELYYNAAKLETIYGLLVIKNSYLIAERYFNKGSVEQKARLQSVTKSFTSALVGIALDQGLLSSVDQKMIDFFPEVADKITDLRKKQITIRYLLQMRGGYPREESHPDFWKGLLSGHYPPLIEEFPLVSDPGTRFHYSNLTSNWLGIIVDRACGMNLKAYAEEHLFSPLDVKAGEWGQDAEGHNNGCGDLHLTARDAAKFGLLYLNDGVYGGNQIVPAAWVHDSLQTYSVNEAFIKKMGDFRDIGYGYQWWSANAGRHHVNFAWGHGGQLIVLVDEFDMVIVTTSYPFWLEHNDQSWKHEKAIIKLVGKFINSLPKE